MSDAVFVVNAQHRLVDLNPAGAKLLGPGAAVAIGQPVEQVFAAWPALVARLHEAHVIIETTLDLAVGPHSYEFRIADWRDQHNAPRGWIIIASDVTVQRRVRDLTTLNAILEATNRSLQVNEVVQTFCREMEARLRAPAGRVFLYDEARDAFLLAARWGLPEQALQRGDAAPVIVRANPQAVWEEWTAVCPVPEEFDLPWDKVWSFPLLAQGEVQGIAEVFNQSGAFGEHQAAYFSVVGQNVGAALRNARLYEEVERGRAQLQRLSQQLVEVQEAERRFLAAELHDEIGQALTALRLALVVAEGGGMASRLQLERAHQMVSDLIQRVRQLSLDLRPAMLDDLGLLPALLWLIERYTAQTRIQVDFRNKCRRL